MTPELLEEMRRLLSKDDFRQIRRLRVDEGRPWRDVAAICEAEWGETWGATQETGRALCAVAAAFFGEDWEKAPWD